jgi:hypothetical protein
MQSSLAFDELAAQGTEAESVLAAALQPPRALLAFIPLAELTNSIISLFNFVRCDLGAIFSLFSLSVREMPAIWPLCTPSAVGVSQGWRVYCVWLL